jgi:hypothetical protein
VHIPKNAGISIWETFGASRNRSQHLTVEEIKGRIDQNKFDSYNKFAIIRNTYSRVVSLYNYYIVKNRVDRGWQKPVGDFKDFVMRLGNLIPDGCMDEKPLRRFIEFRQLDWISINGKIAVDSVLRFEDLPNCFIDFQKEELGSKNLLNMRRENVTGINVEKMFSEMDNEVIEKIQDYYRGDIEEFKCKLNK